MPGTTTRLSASKPLSSDLLSSGAGVTASGLDTVDAAVWVHRGTWSSSVTYAVNDVVDDADSTYLSILAGINHEPPNATYWRSLGSAPTTLDFGALIFLRANF